MNLREVIMGGAERIPQGNPHEAPPHATNLRHYHDHKHLHLFHRDGQPRSKVAEGPEKATRGGVNGSQSKFLNGIWPITQNQPEPALF
jgi:hypothetical protein